MILKGKHILYLYLLLWIVYELQGLVGLSGSALSLGIVVFLNLVSIYYAIMVNFKVNHNPIYVKALNLLLLMFTFYGILYCLDGPHYMLGVREDKPYNYLKSIYNSLLPIYVFYYFSRKNILTNRMMKYLVFVFYAVAILAFWESSMDLKATMEKEGMEGRDFVNNIGYSFLGLFPVLSLLRKRISIQYVGIVVLMTFLLLSMKRGAILVGVLCLVMLLLEMFQSSKRWKKLIIVILSLGTVMIVAYFSWYMLKSSDYFQNRLWSTIEGNSSGRDLLYYTFWNHVIYDTNAFHFLFGSGANATLEVFVEYAHNDWLELAVNQGVLGVMIYAYYWYAFGVTWRNMDKRDGVRFAFGMVLFIYFVRTFFSMSYGAMDIYSTCLLGYCLGEMRRKEQSEV